MFKAIKNRSSRAAFMGAICLLALPLIISCKKESPTVSAADLVASATSTLPGYYEPRVMGVYPADGSIGNPTDTQYVIVFNIPVNAADFIAGISINSSSVGALTYGALNDYTINPIAGSSTYAVITFNPYGTGVAGSPIPGGDTITVNIGPTIRTPAPDNIPMAGLVIRTFTVGAGPDTTAPNWIAGSRAPANGAAGVALTTAITINFSETINPTTVDSTTFRIREQVSGYVVPVTYTVSAVAPYTITMTPGERLLPGTVYEVILSSGVSRVADLAGNLLSTTVPAIPPWTWTFTTVNTDPYPGNPTLTYGPFVTGFDAAGTTANLHWGTSESTNCTIRYGTGTDVVSTASETATDYFSDHYFALGAPLWPVLTNGKRYWMRFNAGDIEDRAGNTNLAATALVPFNAPTLDVPAPLDVHPGGGLNNQNGISLLQSRYGAALGGLFVFYADNDTPNTYRRIYGQLYDNALATQWPVTTPLFMTAVARFSLWSAVEDEEGGVILLAYDQAAANGIFAKRIDSAGGFVNWGASADAANDMGLSIDDNGTADNGISASAVPVYAGQIDIITGVLTADRDAFTGNLYKDDWSAAWGDISDFMDADLQAGNIVLNTTTNTWTTVADKPVNYRYMMRTTVAIPNGNNYVIADHTASEAITVQDHYIYTTPATAVFDHQANGADLFYTEHYTSAFLTLGDVIINGAAGGIVNAFNTVNFTGGAPYGYSGSLIQDSAITNYAGGAPWWIEDTSVGDFSSLAALDDLVYNDTDNVSTFVIAPLLASSILNINDQASFDGSVGGPPYELYKIYRGNYCLDHLDTAAVDPFYEITVNWNMALADGNNITIYDSHNTTTATLTADQNPYPNPLMDEDSDFIADGVADGDIVINYTDREAARVDGTCIHRHALRMNNDIVENGDSYQIIRFTDGVTGWGDVAAVGLATGATAGHLIDASNGFGLVSTGDIVYNITDNRYAKVALAAAGDLTLYSDASFGAGDRYIVFRRDTGVLYVWQETAGSPAGIYAKVLDIDGGGAPATLLASQQILTGGEINPYTVSDDAGSAIVIFEDSTNYINAALVDCRGAVSSQILIDNNGAHTNQKIKKVVRDTQGGALVMYTYLGPSLAVQWIRNTGGALARGNGGTWPDGGRTIGALPTSYDMDINYSAASPQAVVVYETAGDIYAQSVGQVTWAATAISTPTWGIQQRPKVFINAANTIILWEDNRFSSSVGYGLFSMKINSADGSKNALWDVDLSAATELNGAAAMLNSYNSNWPNMAIIPYNNNTRAAVFWEDFRVVGENANVRGMRFDNLPNP